MPSEGLLLESNLNGIDPPARAEPIGRMIANLEKSIQATRRVAAFPVEPERDSLEREWLSRNRKLYAEKWTALEGDELLTVSDDAREVVAKVRGRSTPALVIQIETEELPFAGW